MGGGREVARVERVGGGGGGEDGGAFGGDGGADIAVSV